MPFLEKGCSAVNADRLEESVYVQDDWGLARNATIRMKLGAGKSKGGEGEPSPSPPSKSLARACRQSAGF
jgi:hypothetical protein